MVCYFQSFSPLLVVQVIIKPTEQKMINLREFRYLDLLNSSTTQVQSDGVFNIEDNDGNSQGNSDKLCRLISINLNYFYFISYTNCTQL